MTTHDVWIPDNVVTIRDHLAMAALAGLTAPLLTREADMVRLSRAAYRWADEMLDARRHDPAHLKELVDSERRMNGGVGY